MRNIQSNLIIGVHSDLPSSRECLFNHIGILRLHALNCDERFSPTLVRSAGFNKDTLAAVIAVAVVVAQW